MQSNLDDKHLEAQIQHILEKYYAEGRLVRVRKICGGYVNRSYAVWVNNHGRLTKYFLRTYNPATSQNEIRFEHALMGHLRQQGFHIVSGIIDCRDGSTFVKISLSGKASVCWALFEFLEGDSPYTWVKTDLSDTELVNAAGVLARLHHAGRDFVKPEGADRVQPRIMDFLPAFQRRFSGYLRQAGDRHCDRLFQTHKDRIYAIIDACIASGEKYGGMLEVPVHCDFHPGNLKYRDEKIVGLFDFDWAKIDYRLFDVALGLLYFTSEWHGAAAGSLRMQKFKLFLRGYHDQCHRLDGMEPLTQREREGLASMLAAANLFVLNWDLTDFYEAEKPDDNEYYTYIEHNILVMDWIEAHSADIHHMTQRVCA